MFVPITSEVIIGTGAVLKEISTGHLFEVGTRLNSSEEIWGDDFWELHELNPANHEPTVLAVRYVDITRKFFMEVND